VSPFYKAVFALILLQSNFSLAQGKIIMNGAATMNVVKSAYVVTTDVSLTSADTLNVNNSTIRIAGSITNSSGAFDVTKGTVDMFGLSAQTIPSGAFYTNKIKNLIISNDVTLLGQDSLTGILSFGPLDSKTFSTGGFLTLKSTAAGTANVADLTNDDVNSGNQVLGDVIVERYLSADKKWRFLSIPTSTTQTIKTTWQESSTANGNAVAGYGTQITGAGGTAAGFDVLTATPSMKTYNTLANNWVGVPNTNVALINNPTNNTMAYFVFVRGDRSVISAFAPATPTILRTKGVIKQNDQAIITIASPITAFTAVGNPYPARIDLRRMTPAPTTATKIYVWDPLATNGSAAGYGAYQTLTFDGSDFSVTPGGGSYGSPLNRDPNYIESGEAFLVGGNSSPYNITFRETVKPAPMYLSSITNGHPQSLQARLFSNKNGVTLLMDGIKADIGDNFSNYLDNDDAFKLMNSAENVSLKRSGQLLSVERHSSISDQDTFYLNTANMKVQNYQWQLGMNNINQAGLTGFLEDSYLHSSTPLNVSGNTAIDFNVENTAGSMAADRFRIVFRPLVILPVTFTTLKAWQDNKNIAVEWKVENEKNLEQYNIEKSIDGNHFTTVGKVAANNAVTSKYQWLDVNAAEGYNYYRLLSRDVNGKTAYSTIVKVLIGKARQSITIYPNPVTNGRINLQLGNQPAGVYGIRVMNKLGQVLVSKQINHEEGSSTETIQLDKSSAHGIYQLEVTKPDGNTVDINVIN